MDLANPSYLWLIAGVILVALEAFGVSGVGLFFAGLAAICVGVLVEVGAFARDAYLLQIAAALTLTVAWAYFLWKPLRRRRFGFGKVEATYANMIGDTAIVSGAGLKQGMVGDVIWSGTIMKAELPKSVGDVTVTAGSQVIISEVKGSTLIVEPK